MALDINEFSTRVLRVLKTRLVYVPTGEIGSLDPNDPRLLRLERFFGQKFPGDARVEAYGSYFEDAVATVAGHLSEEELSSLCQQLSIPTASESREELIVSLQRKLLPLLRGQIQEMCLKGVENSEKLQGILRKAVPRLFDTGREPPSAPDTLPDDFGL